MSEGDEEEPLDAIVTGFEGDDCLISPTQNLSQQELEKLIGHTVTYEDFKGVIWKGKILQLIEDYFLVRFDVAALSEGGPSGLGNGSLVRISARD